MRRSLRFLLLMPWEVVASVFLTTWVMLCVRINFRSWSNGHDSENSWLKVFILPLTVFKLENDNRNVITQNFSQSDFKAIKVSDSEALAGTFSNFYDHIELIRSISALSTTAQSPPSTAAVLSAIAATALSHGFKAVPWISQGVSIAQSPNGAMDLGDTGDRELSGKSHQ